MFLRVLAVIAPVFVCVLIGFIWTRTGRPYETRFVTRVIMNVGAPFLIISAFNRTTLDKSALTDIGIAVATTSAVVAVIAFIVLRLLKSDMRTYFPSLVFWNSGNMGIPICYFAFGEAGLSLSIVIFMWVMMLNFTAGVAIASGHTGLSRLVRLPLVYAAIIAVVLSALNIKLPVWLADTTELLGNLTIPLMLLTLGASLTSIQARAIWRSLGYSALRFGIGFAAGVIVSNLFGLTGASRGVLILQASMPPAVFNYMIAARYERNADEVACLVATATLLSFIFLPAVLWFVLI